MKGILFFALILLFKISSAYSQENLPAIADIEKQFKAFEYREVITLSETFLAQQTGSSREALIEVYRMRAIAFYSLGELNASLGAFLEILRLDPGYQFDPVKTSPKIIDFFEEIRTNFLQTRMNDTTQSTENQPAVEEEPNIQTTESNGHLRRALVRSMVLPGWGHLDSGYSTKGWMLMGLSIGALAGSVYFIRETQLREEDYLNETDHLLIESRYEEFNTAYQKRNIFLAAYVVIWLYTQIDLLYFSKDRSLRQNPLPITLSPSVSSLPAAHRGAVPGILLNIDL